MKRHPAVSALFVIVLIFTQVSGISALASDAPAIADLSGHWVAPYISALTEEGIDWGSPDGVFRPDESITLKETVMIVVSAAYGGSNSLRQCGSDPGSEYIAEALRIGLVDQQTYSDSLKWDNQVSRSEMARIVHMALALILGEADETDVSFAGTALVDLDSCNVCRPHIEQFLCKRHHYRISGQHFLRR